MASSAQDLILPVGIILLVFFLASGRPSDEEETFSDVSTDYGGGVKLSSSAKRVAQDLLGGMGKFGMTFGGGEPDESPMYSGVAYPKSVQSTSYFEGAVSRAKLKKDVATALIEEGAKIVDRMNEALQDLQGFLRKARQTEGTSERDSLREEREKFIAFFPEDQARAYIDSLSMYRQALMKHDGLNDTRNLQPFHYLGEETIYDQRERINLHTRLERMDRSLKQALSSAEDVLSQSLEIEDQRQAVSMLEAVMMDFGPDTPQVSGNPRPSSHALPTAPQDLEEANFDTLGQKSSRLDEDDEFGPLPMKLDFEGEDEAPSTFQSLRTVPPTPRTPTQERSAGGSAPSRLTRQQGSSPLKDYVRSGDGNVPVRSSAPRASGFNQGSAAMEAVYSESPISKSYKSFSKYSYEIGKTEARITELAEQVGALQGSTEDKRGPLQALREEIVKAQPPQFLAGEWAKSVKDQVAATMSTGTQIRYSKLLEDTIFLQYKAILEQVHGLEEF